MLSQNGVFVLKTFCPQNDAIRSDHSLIRNVPKLTYITLQNFPTGETPGPLLKGGRGRGGKGGEGDRRGKRVMGKE